jgi:hypothetical protein
MPWSTLKAVGVQSGAGEVEHGGAGEWTDPGRVFTREDGTPLRPAWISTRFDTLAARAGLPPITLHGLRHGAATMLLAAGQPPKVVSEIQAPRAPHHWHRPLDDRPHPRAARRRGVCQTGTEMITEMAAGTSPVQRSACSRAEARGFEPRMGANPNRISSAAP